MFLWFHNLPGKRVGQPPCTCTGRLFVNYVEARLTSWQQSFMNPRRPPPVLPDMPDMPDKKNKLAGSSSFLLNIPFLSPLCENSFLRPSFFLKKLFIFCPPVVAGWDGSQKKKYIIWSLFSLPPPSVQDSDSLCVPWMDGQNATTTYYILRTTPPISVFVSPPTWHTLQLPLFSPTFLFQHLSFFFFSFQIPLFPSVFARIKGGEWIPLSVFRG